MQWYQPVHFTMFLNYKGRYAMTSLPLGFTCTKSAPFTSCHLGFCENKILISVTGLKNCLNLNLKTKSQFFVRLLNY